ncbi:MAG: hypothetical protein M0Z69_00540, partial [Actinomycetota bacterium]|nr:hypothetical protein [Actinomycetota bacterium]
MSPERIRPGSARPGKTPGGPPSEETAGVAPAEPERAEANGPASVEPPRPEVLEGPEATGGADTGVAATVEEEPEPDALARRRLPGLRRAQAASEAAVLPEAAAGAVDLDTGLRGEPGGAGRRHGLFRRLYYGETSF